MTTLSIPISGDLEKFIERMVRDGKGANKIQARVDGKIVASRRLTALRKDVTGYLYGGDRTRKMKLWKLFFRPKEKLLWVKV